MEVAVYQHDARDSQVLPATSSDVVPTLAVDTKVCVRNRFLGDWTTGFKVAEVLRDGYRIRRQSDGHDFPDVFAFEDVRLERRQHPLREIGGSNLDRRH
ncbi:MAG TPA: hypothetical protein VK215_14295 [Acidimicrobiales bacterium]|nr:hypothetical protein [Acidimicrobiales bacterium]